MQETKNKKEMTKQEKLKRLKKVKRFSIIAFCMYLISWGLSLLIFFRGSNFVALKFKAGTIMYAIVIPMLVAVFEIGLFFVGIKYLKKILSIKNLEYHQSACDELARFFEGTTVIWGVTVIYVIFSYMVIPSYYHNAWVWVLAFLGISIGGFFSKTTEIFIDRKGFSAPVIIDLCIDEIRFCVLLSVMILLSKSNMAMKLLANYKYFNGLAGALHSLSIEFLVRTGLCLLKILYMLSVMEIKLFGSTEQEKTLKKEKTMKKHLWLTIALVVVDCIATIVVYTGDANVFTKLCWWFNDARMWEIPLLLLWIVYNLMGSIPNGTYIWTNFKKQKEENLKMKQEIKTE